MSVNKVILMGHLGRDPEVRYMPNGEAVCNFSIATTENWKDKQGNKQSKSEWHNIVAYRKLAEICGEWLKTGSQCYVEGKLQTRQWEKDGVKRYSTEVIIEKMDMIGSKQDNASGGDYAQSKSYSKAGDPGGFDDMEEDLPPF
jgi:single-strand DNA-binding protein